MRVTGLALLAGSLAATVVVSAATQDRAAAIDKAFDAFWAAGDRASAAERAVAVVKSGVSFDEALARVRRGREYDRDVPRGLLFGRHHTSSGLEHQYAFVVPATYDPSRPQQVRVQLHGGVGRRRPPAVNRIRVDALPGSVEEIAVFPVGWSESMWWSWTQVDSLARALDRLKRRYNIDENRVYLTGTSDGATGVFFMALKDTTPWACFLPLIGDMMVLATPSVGADGDMHPGNALNKPFFIVNGGRDPLYPAHVTQLYARHLESIGAEVIFRVHAESGHSVAWWPEEQADFEAFVHDHPREPLPDRLSWETERTDRYNRAHWLVIDRLGDVDGQSRLADTNVLRRGREYDFGLRINSGVDRGRRVQEVVADSSAYEMGLRPGDRFVEVNGRLIQSGMDVAEGVRQLKIGDPVRVVVERGGKRVGLGGTFNPTEVEVPPAPIFPRHKPPGRVDLTRRGNTVEVSTQGVRAFTLLLSPSLFDFRRKVTVVANGRTVFDGLVEPSVGTLMKWAARDNDRTMVFGAELSIDLGT